MRMRKLKWAAEFLENCPYLEHEPDQNKGKWKQLLNCETLHVEIGSGKGDYWIEMSQMYPSEGWIGLEKQESVAALALRKAAHSLPNRRFIYKDAANIDEYFAPEEIDVIHLNFSDPWPKRRNRKRRLTDNRFLDKYYDLLSPNGCIIMKTDNKDLFAYSLIELNNHKFILEECDLDYRRNEHPEDAYTEYERKFSDKGQPIYRGVWRKK